MQGKRAFKRGRMIFFVLAGGVGYLLGSWHAAAIRTPDLSPSQTVALRFPEELADAAPPEPLTSAPASSVGAAHTTVLGERQLALLDPAPMVPRAAVHDAAPEAAAAAPKPLTDAAPAPPRAAASIVPPASRSKTAAAQIHQHPDRPGAVLNDEQIASIKARLHLTPDQETMWPAVEAALRNVAYAQAREARRRGVPARARQLAATGPDSIEVQGLKAAAIPLIMSFSAEQKSEVRSMAHVMGLDNLASQL